MRTCISTGEAGGIESSDRDHGTSLIRCREYPFLDPCQPERENPLHEFVELGVVGNPIRLQDLADRVHDCKQVDETAIIRSQVFLEQQENQQLVLGVGFLRVFAGVERQMGHLDSGKTCLDNVFAELTEEA